MFIRLVSACLTALSLIATQSAFGGYYGNMDTEEEVKRYSLDYKNVFDGILDNLRTLPVATPVRPPPMYHRYALMETLAISGALRLRTVEDKLNYTSLLIRRGKPDKA